MLKRLVIAFVGLVGAVVIALGVASATLWRADDVLVADLRADAPIVVTDPGVLELAATEVTVRVEADGPVVLAVGRDTDVDGWVGGDAHQRITGLAGWHELAAEDVAAPAPEATPEDEASAAPEATPEGEAPAEGADAAPEGEAPADAQATTEEPADAAAAADPAVPNPAGSDMWVVEASGDGEAELTWTQQPGRWTVLAVSTDGSGPRVSLAWPQEVTTPWLWPAVGVGSLLVVLAAGLLVRDLRRARRGPEADWTPVLTGPLPAVGADGAPVQLTRRQLRELAAHGALTDSGVAAPRDGARLDEAPGPETPPSAPGVAALTPAASPSSARTGAGDASGGRRGRRAGTAPDDASRPGAATDERPAPGGPAPSAAQRPGPTVHRSDDDVRGRRPGDGTPAPAAPGAALTGARPAWLRRGPQPSTDAGTSGTAPAAPATDGAAGARQAAPQRTPEARDPQGTTQGTTQEATQRASRPGWGPVPPPPGAVVGRADGPDAVRRAPASPAPRTSAAPEGAPEHVRETSGAAAPRPAWLRDAPTPPGPRAAGRDTTGADPAASRADAWRRAWGLPPLPTDDDSPEEGR